MSQRSTTIVPKAVGGLLALLVVSLVVFVSCGVPGGSDDGEIEVDGPLDDRARAACEIYTPIVDDVRSGELSGPRLFRALQDVFNEARLSATEGFDDVSRLLLNAAIAGDVEARNDLADQLEDACED